MIDLFDSFKKIELVAILLRPLFLSYVILCANWYHLYNLKNVKNTLGGVLPLGKVAV